MELAVALTHLDLEIAEVEDLEEVEGHHRQQLENEDGAGVVLVDVVDFPAIDGLVESKILNILTGMAEPDDDPGRGDVRGEHCDPHPVAGLFLDFSGSLAPDFPVSDVNLAPPTQNARMPRFKTESPPTPYLSTS